MLDAFLFGRHVEADEKVSRIVHAHWLLGIKYLLVPAVSFLLAVLVLYSHPTRFFFYLTSLWSVLSLVWLMRNFCDYYLDVWIITDQGVISLEWLGWFHRQSTRVLYSDVQGVSHETHGIAGTFLRFGTVSIEKVSTGTTVSLESVPRPKLVETLILRNREAYLHSKNMHNSKHVQEILSEIVSHEIQLRSVQKKAPPPPAPTL
ncbi:MAG: Uncharacterized protein Greene041619_818 [Candidatus Peregrinibacteria bacterium Greene0416_19]|nr:MAG: Uncharacterized protein Greene041619_818 [Candidatus Peregrinibacteria bacterium Greene0416_19]